MASRTSYLRVRPLRAQPLGAAGVAPLLTRLHRNAVGAKLEYLDLSSTEMCCAGAAAAGRYLGGRGCTALRCLELSNCGIGLEGARALAAGLEANGTLKFVNISRNQIATEGMLALGVALQRSERSVLGYAVCDSFR